MRKICSSCLLVTIGGLIATSASADVVTEWNRHMLQAARAANTNPVVITRVAAIVQGSMFDALNGIERRYTPLYVQPDAQPGASRRAAIVQAAYASLVRLYPDQAGTFGAKRAESLSAIARGTAAESSVSITRGIEWGQAVADAIWTWRSADGFSATLPPFVGGSEPGQWRPTPPGYVPGIGLEFASMTPWVMSSASQFRPAGPPALTSARYTADYKEVQTLGGKTSLVRTPDETTSSLFWNASTSAYYWETAAVSLAMQRNTTLSENARLLALLSVAVADAAIGCWDAKYTYQFWRPVTAITLGDSDGNPDTIGDSSFEPLLTTPPHPDYPSGHSCMSGAAGRILSEFFGENTPLTVGSDVMLDTVRAFANFSAAVEEVKNARIVCGIHFRSACEDGERLGIDVANYILDHAFLPVHGEHAGQLR